MVDVETNQKLVGVVERKKEQEKTEEANLKELRWRHQAEELPSVS